MVRKKDQFWRYVEDLDVRFKCSFCRRDFAGGASRIKFHLAGVKGHAIDICANVPEDVQKEAYLVIGGSNKKVPKRNLKHYKCIYINNLSKHTNLIELYDCKCMHHI